MGTQQRLPAYSSRAALLTQGTANAIGCLVRRHSHQNGPQVVFIVEIGIATFACTAAEGMNRAERDVLTIEFTLRKIG